MLWVPPTGDIRWESNTGSGGSATPGTACTTGGAATTKGTPVQLIAATAFDAYWVTIIASNYCNIGTASQGSLDIGIGASTESILIPDLLMGYCGGNATGQYGGPKQWDFPLYIPAGSRLTGSVAGARTATACNVAIFLYGGNGSPGFPVGTKVTTYGAGTVPRGTAITPGVSGAEGGWTQITASTTEDHFTFIPSFQLATDTTVNPGNCMVDMGFGAATEEEMIGQYIFNSTQTESMSGPNPTFPCFKRVPSGSRLTMRASNSLAINDGGYDGVIHAVS